MTGTIVLQELLCKINRCLNAYLPSPLFGTDDSQLSKYPHYNIVNNKGDDETIDTEWHIYYGIKDIQPKLVSSSRKHYFECISGNNIVDQCFQSGSESVNATLSRPKKYDMKITVTVPETGRSFSVDFLKSSSYNGGRTENPFLGSTDAKYAEISKYPFMGSLYEGSDRQMASYSVYYGIPYVQPKLHSDNCYTDCFDGNISAQDFFRNGNETDNTIFKIIGENIIRLSARLPGQQIDGFLQFLAYKKQ